MELALGGSGVMECRVKSVTTYKGKEGKLYLTDPLSHIHKNAPRGARTCACTYKQAHKQKCRDKFLPFYK
jgi:hypothetical protein